MKSRSRTIVYTLVAVALVVTAGVVYARSSSDSSSNTDGPTLVETEEFAPPTEEEKQAGDAQKEEVIELENQTLPDQATVAIVDASQYGSEVEVRAFVANTIQDGTCTIVFEKDSEQLTKKVPAFADATTTPCMNLVVPRSEFSAAGEWNVMVTYTNNTIMGSASSIIVIE